MPKRKAGKAAAGQPKSKKGAAAASLTVGSGPLNPAALLAVGASARARISQLYMDRVNCSMQLGLMLRNLGKLDNVELMTALAEELEADSEREQSLIDLNHKLAGGGTLLTLLIESVMEHAHWQEGDPEEERQIKNEACDIFETQLPHLLKLVRACDPALKSKDGETALSLICSKFVPFEEDNVTYLIAEALLKAGANTEARDRNGSTPLQAWVYGGDESACGPLLLLRHGAHIDAQDSAGDSMLHLLVHSAGENEYMMDAFRELAESGYLALADFTLLNNDGQTALQLAKEHVEEFPEDEVQLEVLETLHAHSLLWSARNRPVMYVELREKLRPDGKKDGADMAEIVLGYVDGSERPSERAAAASSAAAPAAAAAVAHA